MDNTKWYERSGAQSDIAISTRIRLARNVADIPFPGRMTGQQQQDIIDKAVCAMGSRYTVKSIEDFSAAERTAMAERHMISPEFAKAEGKRAVILSEDEGVSVMINEEDHIRIQVMGSGVCLNDCLARAESVDNLLEKEFRFAFDEKLGYLTHCPTNLGTGLRASVMLHLPALTETGAIRGLISSVSKLGFTVRGFFGEGSEAQGALYQVSNQMTLGLTEAEAVGRLNGIVDNIISQEQNLRDKVMSENSTGLEDRVWRSAGTLATARRMTTEEAMNLLSSLRLGVASGIVHGISAETINRLLWEIQPATLTIKTEAAMPPGVRDIKRAELMRKYAQPLITAIGGLHYE